MLTYDELRLNKRQFLVLTGLTVKEFRWLLPAFQAVYERQQPPERTQNGSARQRRVGAGRTSVLDAIEQKLLFVLVYQKTYPLQSVIANLFGLSQPRADRWIHVLLPLLRDALTDLAMMPEREPRRFARSERQRAGGATVIIDGSGRRRQRPKNNEKQQLHYSGRKKAHSDKNVLIADAKTTRIGFLGQTYAGKDARREDCRHGSDCLSARRDLVQRHWLSGLRAARAPNTPAEKKPRQKELTRGDKPAIGALPARASGSNMPSQASSGVAS